MSGLVKLAVWDCGHIEVDRGRPHGCDGRDVCSASAVDREYVAVNVLLSDWALSELDAQIEAILEDDDMPCLDDWRRALRAVLAAGLKANQASRDAETKEHA